MIKNRFGELVFDQDDLCDLVMRGIELTQLHRVTASPEVDIEALIAQLEDPSAISTWTFSEGSDISVRDFDVRNQIGWFMPDGYKNLDIAQHVLDLCTTQEQLQRVGEELLLYHEKDLMDLLRYLKYLVDVMTENRVIWGVGRGSSVASYVLFLLGVHRIDSLHYNLSCQEFLR